MRKRKLKLVKVAKVEAVACLTYNSELDWKFDKPSKEFLELIDKL